MTKDFSGKYRIDVAKKQLVKIIKKQKQNKRYFYKIIQNIKNSTSNYFLEEFLKTYAAKYRSEQDIYSLDNYIVAIAFEQDIKKLDNIHEITYERLNKNDKIK